MAVDLIQRPALKADAPVRTDADQQRAAEDARKAANIDAALNAFASTDSRKAAERLPRVGSSSGIGAIMGGAHLASLDGAPREAKKADQSALSPEVARLALPDDAARLLDAVITATRGRLDGVRLAPSTIADALGIDRDRATHALELLEHRFLIIQHYNQDGIRDGFRANLP